MEYGVTLLIIDILHSRHREAGRKVIFKLIRSEIICLICVLFLL